MDRSELLYRIKSSIISKEPDAEIYLYGSRARGDNKTDSDWDILVITPKEKVTFDYEVELINSIFNLELDTGEIISLLVYSKSDFQKKRTISPLFTNVSREGIKL